MWKTRCDPVSSEVEGGDRNKAIRWTYSSDGRTRQASEFTKWMNTVCLRLHQCSWLLVACIPLFSHSPTPAYCLQRSFSHSTVGEWALLPHNSGLIMCQVLAKCRTHKAEQEVFPALPSEALTGSQWRQNCNKGSEVWWAPNRCLCLWKSVPGDRQVNQQLQFNVNHRLDAEEGHMAQRFANVCKGFQGKDQDLRNEKGGVSSRQEKSYWGRHEDWNNCRQVGMVRTASVSGRRSHSTWNSVKP